MLSAKILNSSAVLNDFHEISSMSFLAGETKTLVLRLHNEDLDIRYFPASGATLDVVLNNADGTTLTKSATLDTDDRSIARITLSAVETAALIGGNISFTLTEGGVISKGLVSNALTKVLEGDC